MAVSRTLKILGAVACAIDVEDHAGTHVGSDSHSGVPPGHHLHAVSRIQAATSYAAIAAGRSGLELRDRDAVAGYAVLDLAHVHQLAEIDEVEIRPKERLQFSLGHRWTHEHNTYFSTRWMKASMPTAAQRRLQTSSSS
jgi:hypothetical protein